MRDEYKLMIELVNRKYNERVDITFGGCERIESAIEIIFKLKVNYAIDNEFSDFNIIIKSEDLGDLNLIRDLLITRVDNYILKHYKI